MKARVPGSTSNLGPGFDVLGLALGTYIDVEVVDAPQLVVRTEGQGAHLPQDATHLAARVAIDVRGHDRLAVTVRSDIPLGRGLGSSAALVAATAAAAGALDPLAVATAWDGHGENAAASVLGGLVAAPLVDGRVVVRRLTLDPRLGFVVVILDRELSTEKARAALPARVPFADAVANLGRLTLLVTGLADADLLESSAGDDRLHQDARAPLFPEAGTIMSALSDAGAVISCWSGAGTSVLGICRSHESVADVCDAGSTALEKVGLAGRSLVLQPDLTGLVVTP